MPMIRQLSCNIHIYIYIAVLIKICRFFESTLLNFYLRKTITKLDLPTLRNGSIEERTQRNK